MRKSQKALTLVFLAPVLLGAGCGGPQLAEVRGKVTFNGKPLENVRVDFYPDPDKGTRGAGSTGTTDANGDFALTFAPEKPGAVVGHHRVVLTDLDLFGNVFVTRGEYKSVDKNGAPKAVPTKPRFSEAYSDLVKSPLRQEVTPGMGPITLDVKK